MSSGRNSTECRIYVGNLPPDIRTKDIEDLFYKYGKITRVDLKNKRGPPFAFIEFEDHRDAQDAVSRRDGYDYDGYKLRVEFPSGGSGGGRDGGDRGGYGGSGGFRGRGGGGGRGGFRNDRGGGSGGGRQGGGSTRRTQYRVLITGLPASGSWQDLKDHMREAGDVCYADAYKDGTGIVEFLRYDDMKYAVKKLDDSKFRSHEGETAYIRVREDMTAKDGGSSSGGRGGGDRGRSKSRSSSPGGYKKREGSSAKRSYSRSRSRSGERH